MFFGEHLFIVLDIGGDNILTISRTTGLENVELTLICS